MIAVRPASAIAVPSKRPTNTYDVSCPTSPPPSPTTQPQPAKRLHATKSAPRKPPQVNCSEFGSDLDPFVIAHDAATQFLLDANNLAWGTVFEIARGVTKGTWTWSSVTLERIHQLRGPNAQAAHKVGAVMQGCEVPRASAAEIWCVFFISLRLLRRNAFTHVTRDVTRIEYDREQDAILENKGRGLGGMGPWKGKDGWYGGRIQQVGRLVRAQGRFSIQLEKPEIRRSHRFSRYLGSRRILQVRVSDDLLFKYGNDIRLLLSSSKFILCGRVFLPFHAKEGSMYLIETIQDFERAANQQDGDHLRTSLKDFTCWHNPLDLNSQQVRA